MSKKGQLQSLDLEPRAGYESKSGNKNRTPTGVVGRGCTKS